MFESALVVKELPADLWELRRPLVYRGARDTITVPAGFPTDFASVPRPFWWFVPRAGRHTKAAVLHDFLCRRGDHLDPAIHRSDADGIFRRTMREGGVDLLRRWIMWAAVRWTQFGLFRISQGGVGELFGVLAITALALPVLLPGATVVAVSLVAFWVLRLAVYVIARLVGRRSGEPVPRFLAAR
jgi:hypothetical protein